MAGTSHVVDIYLTEVSPSFVATNPQDTVQWSCSSGSSTGASITFTASNPFGSGFSGTVDITNNGTSSKYTISDEAKNGPSVEPVPAGPGSVPSVPLGFDPSRGRRRRHAVISAYTPTTATKMPLATSP